MYEEVAADEDDQVRAMVGAGPLHALVTGRVDAPLDLDVRRSTYTLGRVDEVADEPPTRVLAVLNRVSCRPCRHQAGSRLMVGVLVRSGWRWASRCRPVR